jgi:hypothetical protein
MPVTMTAYFLVSRGGGTRATRKPIGTLRRALLSRDCDTQVSGAARVPSRTGAGQVGREAQQATALESHSPLDDRDRHSDHHTIAARLGPTMPHRAAGR